MNKGLFIHLIVTVIYILTAMWVTDGEQLSMNNKIILLIVYVFPVQLITVAICDCNDYYKQKL